MVTKSVEEEGETLIYEPISFAEQRPNVNPDSPRHFKSKRRRNNANTALKQRPKSLILFRGGNTKKEELKDSIVIKRANTLNDKSHITIKRASSIDSIFDKSGCTENMDRISLEQCKPITSRVKVREIRKVDKKSDSETGLSRSKSDAGMYCPPTEASKPSPSPKVHDYRGYDTDDLLKDRILLNNYNYLYRVNSNSHDSLTTKSSISTNSSRNSSGFYDYSSAENEYETFSSDNSSVHTDDILFLTKTCSSPDKDKHAEGLSYSRSLKKNRRPISIDKMNDIRTSAEYSEDIQYDPNLLSPTMVIDDVFNSNVVLNCKYVDSAIDNTLSIHSAPSPCRTKKASGKKKKLIRQLRPKSLTDMQTIPNVKERSPFSYGRNVRIESVL